MTQFKRIANPRNFMPVGGQTSSSTPEHQGEIFMENNQRFMRVSPTKPLMRSALMREIEAGEDFFAVNLDTGYLTIRSPRKSTLQLSLMSLDGPTLLQRLGTKEFLRGKLLEFITPRQGDDRSYYLTLVSRHNGNVVQAAASDIVRGFDSLVPEFDRIGARFD